MGKIGFNFPIFLTLIHYSVAWILLALFKAISLLPVSPPSKTTPFTSLFFLGAVMAFASGLANTSLKYNRLVQTPLQPHAEFLGYLLFSLTIQITCSVGFYQMAKIAVTPTIVLAEFVLFRKTIASTKVNPIYVYIHVCVCMYTHICTSHS